MGDPPFSYPTPLGSSQRPRQGSLCYTAPSHPVSVLHTCVFHTQSCLNLCNPMACSPSGSSVHGILQLRTLEWVAISSSSFTRECNYVVDTFFIHPTLSFLNCVHKSVLERVNLALAPNLKSFQLLFLQISSSTPFVLLSNWEPNSSIT